MYGKKLLAIISLVSAFIIIGIGLSMKYFTVDSSSGFAYLRSGTAVTSTLSANGALGIGIFTLLFSVWAFSEYLRAKKKYLESVTVEKEIEKKKKSKIHKRKTREAYLRRFGGRSH